MAFGAPAPWDASSAWYLSGARSGPAGTANVTQITLPGFIHSGGLESVELDLTSDEVEESVLFVYVRTTDFWYQLPGYVTSSFHYRTYLCVGEPTSTTLQIQRTEGTGDQEFTELRVLVIPAENLVSPDVEPDWSSYGEVVTYFDLLE